MLVVLALCALGALRDGTALAVSIALHPITTPGYEQTEAIQGSPDGLLVKAAISHRTVMERVTSAPFALGPPIALEALTIGPGPDGNVWAVVAEPGAWVLGSVQASGFLTHHVFPQSPSEWPDLLAPAPDGSEWVGNELGEDLQRVEPDGALATYADPSGGGYPTGIAFTPDGSAWVTTGGVREGIWQIAPSGEAHTLEIPSGRNQFGTCHCDPRSIVAGPDGALWFAERLLGRIGRLGGEGLFTQYAAPNPFSLAPGEWGAPAPEELTLGPDGALWFTEESAGTIGRATLSGGVQIESFALPAAHPGAEFALTGLTDYAGELWGAATETVSVAGVTKSVRNLLFSVDPGGTEPALSAARTPPPPRSRPSHRPRCRSARPRPRASRRPRSGIPRGSAVPRTSTRGSHACLRRNAPARRG